MAHLLGCEGVTLSYPAKTIFSGVTLGIDEGDRIGIVGRNGDGKSSLLRILAEELTPDGGRVVHRSGLRVATLTQRDQLADSDSVGHAIVGDTPEYVWASDARIREIIAALVGELDWDAKIGELSGGQRRRVDLARVLIGDHDVIMLDEPTNHLDIATIAWLAAHLQTRWPKRAGALLVVTHDRWFLDEVSLTTWEVHDGIVERFEGGYSAYVLQRVERDAAAATAEQKRRNLMRRELAWLSRGAQARATKPKFHVKAAQELIGGDPPLRDTLDLRRTAMSRLGKQVVDLFDVVKRFPSREVLSGVTWQIGPGDRFGLLGENGAGKSTLLDLVTGTGQPTSGSVRIGKTVRFATLSQNLTELAPFENDRVRDVLAQHKSRIQFADAELSTIQLLERLGFTSAHLSARVGDLSGGQRRRLQLMLILLDEPNVLILDEPDNDLDIDMLAAIEDLLDTWPGTLLLITHDRHLMERVTDQQYALFDGTLRHLPGGVDQYLGLVAEKKAAASESAVAESASPRETAQPSEPPTMPRAVEYALKKELASLERKMSTAADKVAAAGVVLAETDPSDYVALLASQDALKATESALATLEDRWVEISEQLGS